MLTKQQIVDVINALPEEKFSSIDPIIEELILLEKIDRGLQVMEAGEVLTEEKLDREIEKW